MLSVMHAKQLKFANYLLNFCLIITRTYKDIQAKKWLYTLSSFPLLVSFTVYPQQHTHCTYNEPLRRARATTVAVEK